MAMEPPRDFEDARGEMDRLFAEMPGAPAALVLMVATRGRLGCVDPHDDPVAGPVLPRDRRRGESHERAGQVRDATSAQIEDPHERRRTGTDPRSTASKRWHWWQSPPINKEEAMSTSPQDASESKAIGVASGHDPISNGQDFDGLAERVRILEDKEALRGLMIKGWRALDHKDFDGWISCWSDDAVFEFGQWGALHGRRAIHDTVVEAESPYLTMQHHILNMHFEVSGDLATGVGYMLFVGVADEEQAQNPYSMGGTYEWEYVREDAGWRLKRQRLGVWWTQGEDVISAFEQARAGTGQ